MEHAGSPIPDEIRARLAHPTIRLSGSISHAMVVSFLEPVYKVANRLSISVQEVKCNMASEVFGLCS